MRAIEMQACHAITYHISKTSVVIKEVIAINKAGLIASLQVIRLCLLPSLTISIVVACEI